jgi:hypothetical protein
MRARIVDVDRRPGFEIADDVAPVPLRIVWRSDDATWLEEMSGELDRGFDEGAGPLARCTYVSGPGPHSELMLTFHHCSIDGTAAESLLHELLGCCVAMLDGDANPQPDSLTLQPAADTRLPADHNGIGGAVRLALFATRELTKELVYRARARPRPVPAAGRNRVQIGRLAASDTTAVVRAARNRGVTMTNTLCAAMLLEVDRQLHASNPTRLRAMTFADLRSHLSPPVDAENMGAYIALMRVAVNVDPERGVWSVAQDVQRAFRQSIPRDRFPALRLSAALATANVRLPTARLADVALSYSAAHKVGTSYGSLRVRQLHGCVSNSRTGAQVAAVAGVFDRELWFDVPYLESDCDAKTVAEMVEGMRSTLVEAAW